MNAELVASDQSQIIIPTVFREDYLNALRRLTRRGDPSVLIRAISRVREFSANIIGDDFEKSREYLEKCNAFKDGDGYILKFQLLWCYARHLFQTKIQLQAISSCFMFSIYRCKM